MTHSYIQLDPRDNIIAALRPLKKGEEIHLGADTFSLQEDIPAKHKFTTENLEGGDSVRMYGVLVGKATQAIPKGGLISTENIHHAAETYEIDTKTTFSWQAPDISHWKEKTFEGYLRADGRAGTANYWLVLPLVFCENKNIETLRKLFSESLGFPYGKELPLSLDAMIEAYQQGADTEGLLQIPVFTNAQHAPKNRLFPNVDGIKYLIHEGGCGGTRDDAQALINLLAGYISHPNVAGATVLSLGCQHAQSRLLKEALQKINPQFTKPLYILDQQEVGTEHALMEAAVRQTFVGLIEANKAERTSLPLSKLVLGLECGGSDGFSGISANPVLGHVSDLLAALQGTAILSEFPELNGVEQDLINRCVDQKSAEKFFQLMQTYSARAVEAGSGFDSNPSPGNIKDGLITDAIKSAGAARKGGSSPVTEVLDYTEQSTQAGLNLLCTPGNDVESTTALAGSGANVILFTTGLGTPTGNPVAPVIKVSTNSQLYKRMHDIIDFDAGRVISGRASIAEQGEALLEYIIEVASGRTFPAAVRRGQDDFIPWKRGVSL